ncbi:MAG: PhoH family protein [Gammaproteobacteria bacterium]|nr:MAG: PhoH family protein [Gammaproteobacteria bacterium]
MLAKDPQPLTDLSAPQTCDFVLEPADNDRLANLCGQFNEHLRQVEGRLGVEVSCRGNRFRVVGEAQPVQLAGRVLRDLYREAGRGPLTPDQVHLCLQEACLREEAGEGAGPAAEGRRGPRSPEPSRGPQAKHGRPGEGRGREAVVRTRRGVVRARGASQERYLRAIREHDISFGIGPAGTGKTYLAVACAVQALEEERVARLVLTRPAVEAGERLGFLPGDLSQKVDPYLRPLYDALYEMLGFERVGRLVERNVIEVAPLAYMRGRTLNDAFIILDEAQNTTVEQMKMFLTRIGFGSTVVVTGDVTQVDLPPERPSGLRHVLEVLRGVEGISFTFFQASDVVRHPLVQSIVTAYESHEARAAQGGAGEPAGEDDSP